MRSTFSGSKNSFLLPAICSARMDIFSWADSVSPSLATTAGSAVANRAERLLATGSVDRSSISLVKSALPVAPNCLAIVSGSKESSAANGTPKVSARIGSSLPVSSSTLWKISPDANPYAPPRTPVLKPSSAPSRPKAGVTRRVAVSANALTSCGPVAIAASREAKRFAICSPASAAPRCAIRRPTTEPTPPGTSKEAISTAPSPNVSARNPGTSPTPLTSPSLR